MLFIIVTGSIMAVSILIIYRLCHHFGIELKYASLVLCAVMAFLVNAAAIMLSSALDVSHLIRLGVMILVAAALVTLFNEHLLRHPDAEDTADEVNEAETAAADSQPAANAEPAEATAELATPAGISAAAVTEPEQPTKPAEAAAKPATPTEETSATAVIEPEQSAESAEKAAEQPAPPAEPPAIDAVKPDQPVESAGSVKSSEADQTNESPVAGINPPADTEPAETADIAAATGAAPEAAPLATSEAAEPESVDPLIGRSFPPPVTDATPAERSAVDAVVDDIDALLDMAYSNTSPTQAIYACQQHIKHYPTDPMELPFMLSQLIRLYRELGDYQAAINTCQNALLRPIIIGNDAALVQFKENLRYLGLVQDILDKHNASNIPFAEIPSEIRQEIERAADSAE